MIAIDASECQTFVALSDLDQESIERSDACASTSHDASTIWADMYLLDLFTISLGYDANDFIIVLVLCFLLK